MHAAVYVGVVTALIVVDGVDHRAWALSRGAIIQVRQRLAVHGARQNGELPAQRVHIEGGGEIGQCDIFHRNFRSVCESGSWEINAFSMAARADSTDMPVSTSARNANTSRLCAVSRSRPRDSM